DAQDVPGRTGAAGPDALVLRGSGEGNRAEAGAVRLPGGDLEFGGDGDLERKHLEVLLKRQVDGLIVASAQHDKEFFDKLSERKIPFVFIDRMVSGMDANYVGVKDEDLGAMATQHLIDQGCTRIAHIRGPAVTTGAGRLRGYRRALAKAGMKASPEYVVSG